MLFIYYVCVYEAAGVDGRQEFFFKIKMKSQQ